MIVLPSLVSTPRVCLRYALFVFEASGCVCTRRQVAVVVLGSDVQLDGKVMMILHALPYQVGSLLSWQQPMIAGSKRLIPRLASDYWSHRDALNGSKKVLWFPPNLKSEMETNQVRHTAFT